MGSPNLSLLRRLGREEREVRQRIAALRRQWRRGSGVPDLPVGWWLNVSEATLAAPAEHHEEIVRQRLVEKSQALANALERVRDGSYGLCRVCGCRIPRRRLEALPTATLCVLCQEQREAARAA